jgi:hypothetical protein
MLGRVRDLRPLGHVQGARNVFFNGRKDADGRSIDRGVVSVRGVKAAAEIRAAMQKLEEARRRRREHFPRSLNRVPYKGSCEIRNRFRDP